MNKKTVTEKFDEQGRLVERVTVTEEPQYTYVPYNAPGTTTPNIYGPYTITSTTGNLS